MRRILLVVVLACGASGAASAQSSIFGIRGLGIPQAPLSARSFGMAGSAGYLDGMSGTNPAAITSIVGLTAGIDFYQNWRSSTTPGGTGSASDAGLPYVNVVNRVKETPYYFSGSFGSYTDRAFGTVTSDTTSLNGVPVGFRDSLESRGGVSDFRLAFGYRKSAKAAFGLGFHFITGSNRISLNRSFSDSVFEPVVQRSELAYNAIGFSLGAVLHPTEPLLLTAVVRRDGNLNVDRDSIQALTYTMPWTFGGGVQYRIGTRGTVSAQGTYTTWGDANEEIQAAGGIGADNTIQAALGAELATSRTSPGKLPLRLGIRTATLPFPLAEGEQASEFAAALGTGVRFAKGRAAADLGLERYWRSSGGGFSEDGWTVVLGLVLKP